MIQHYVGEVTEKHFCRMVSQSDAISSNGRTKVHVVWELSVKVVDANHCNIPTTWSRLRRTVVSQFE